MKASTTREQPVLAGLVAILLALLASAAAVRAVSELDKSESSYIEEITRTYDFKFGPNPFAPSNASSATGTFIPGEKFVASTRCGTCHTDAPAQWRQSAHGNAFREPFHQKNVKDLQNQRGPG